MLGLGPILGRVPELGRLNPPLREDPPKAGRRTELERLGLVTDREPTARLMELVRVGFTRG